MNTELMKFYSGKKVLVTGHTGFKGSWLCQALLEMGALVYGYALDAPTDPSLYELLGLERDICSVRGDIRETAAVIGAVQALEPEVVFHLAAQPLVLRSYEDTVYTYETNVLGTVNILEAVRKCHSVRSVVNITTDKVYQNNEWCWGYREEDRLNGCDPYSNSKSCSELVTDSYRRSFFTERDLPVSTARAGNVIGGGDFAADRIIPDAYRAACAGKDVVIRSPYSVRPYQHVLEPVFAYLLLAARQTEDHSLAGSYNIGPESGNCVTTLEIASKFCEKWGGVRAQYRESRTAHEAQFLRLDCSKFKQTMNWKPLWGIDEALDHTVSAYRRIADGMDIRETVREQIRTYFRQMTQGALK